MNSAAALLQCNQDQNIITHGTPPLRCRANYISEAEKEIAEERHEFMLRFLEEYDREMTV